MTMNTDESIEARCSDCGVLLDTEEIETGRGLCWACRAIRDSDADEAEDPDENGGWPDDEKADELLFD